MTTYTKTPDGELVGHKMHAAVSLVALNAGAMPSKNQVARAVGPHGSQDYGYRIVNRCRRKGLIEIDADHEDANPHGRGAVVLTEKGKSYLAAQDDS